MSKEAKVGLFISILCLIMLGLAPTQRRRAPILGTQYKLSFHRVEGLKLGDPVVLGGVPAGRVVGIDFAPREDWGKLSPGQPDVPMVLVTIALDRAQLTGASGYKVVATLNGKHFINILPGNAAAAKVPPGTVLTEELAAEVEDQLGATLRNFKTLAKRSEDMRKQFSDPAFRRDLKDTASNARFYSQEFLLQSNNATLQVEKLRDQLDRQEQNLLAQAQAMDARVARANDYIQRIVPAARGQLNGYRRQLAAAQSQVDLLYTQGDKFVAQINGLAQRLENSPLGKLDQEKLARTVRKTSQQLDDYASLAGDVHAISSDEQVRKDIKAIFTRFRKQSESLKATVKGYDDRLDSFQWLMKDEKEHSNEP